MFSYTIKYFILNIYEKNPKIGQNNFFSYCRHKFVCLFSNSILADNKTSQLANKIDDISLKKLNSNTLVSSPLSSFDETKTPSQDSVPIDQTSHDLPTNNTGSDNSILVHNPVNCLESNQNFVSCADQIANNEVKDEIEAVNRERRVLDNKNKDQKQRWVI